MIDFTNLDSLSIPNGVVNKIEVNGEVVWNAYKYRYVSFGDSIAVGHRINDNWETDYGWNRQYGAVFKFETQGTIAELNAWLKSWESSHPNYKEYGYLTRYEAKDDSGNVVGYYYTFTWTQPTKLVKNSYTELLGKDLTKLYGRGLTTSFARSGDKVKDLMQKLTHDRVKKALAKADYVTVCIGANDVLHYALTGLTDYLTTGDLSTIDKQVNESLAVLNDDNATTSYWNLFNQLSSINPNAKYVFTTVYNPYKYLWIDGSKDGFFEPMLDTIPQMTILGIEVDELIKEGLLNVSVMKDLISRINTIHDKAEEYVTKLNLILRNKIDDFKASNPNFSLADTKSLFDTVPDRVGAGEVHYNDLVNVEYTRGFNTADIRWYPLWQEEYGENYQQYWYDLAEKHTSWEKGFDIMGFARDFVPQVVEKILEPNIDPHPEEEGHYLLMRSFADTFGIQPLKTITYNANGGTGEMAIQKVAEQALGKKIYSITNANKFSPMAHYHFNGWKDNNGNLYSNGQAIYVPNDIVLNAQWEIDKYILTVVQADKSNQVLDPLAVADYPNRKLYVNNKLVALNSEKTSWDKPLSNTETFVVDYGSPIQLSVQGRVEKILPIGNPPKPNCIIKQYNGSDYVQKVVGKLSKADFNMPDRNLTIEYWFNYSANIQYSHSYWDAYIGDKDLKVTYSASND